MVFFSFPPSSAASSSSYVFYLRPVQQGGSSVGPFCVGRILQNRSVELIPGYDYIKNEFYDSFME